MRTLVIWHNLNNNSYYYRFLKIVPRYYKKGYINSYGHQIILILSSYEVQPIVIKKYISIRKALFTPLIKLLTWLSE